MTRPFTRTLATLLAAAGLTACATTPPKVDAAGYYARPIGSAPATANATPYSPGLVCLAMAARSAGRRSPTIAVGRIADYTGKQEDGLAGPRLTQGGSLMAITALAKAGAEMVERVDTSVPELELRYANNKLLSDSGQAAGGYRPITAGQYAGSDYVIAGGITELNYNIRSSGADALAGDRDAEGAKGSFHARVFVMNIAMDIRLVNTRTLEVVDVISYQKQIVGREVGLGLFDFLNGNVFDISAGTGALEPVQLAVRSLVERAVVEMSANLYGMPGPQACMTSDPLGGGTTGATGGFTPAYNNLGTNNATTRADPDRWNDGRSTGDRAPLRGRY